MITNTSPTVTVTKSGDQWTIEFKVAVMTSKITFKIDEEFLENSSRSETPDKVVWCYSFLFPFTGETFYRGGLSST